MAKGSSSHSSGGSTLFIILLLLVAGGLGYWNYTMYQSIQALEHRIYYDNRLGSYTSPAEDQWYDVPDLSISVQIKSGEIIYILFTCEAALTPVSAVTYMHFIVKIDQNPIYASVTSVGGTGIVSTNNKYSVTLQYVNSTLSTGAHSIGIMTERECSGSIQQCVLSGQIISS
jgi:hypothetical protein